MKAAENSVNDNPKKSVLRQFRLFYARANRIVQLNFELLNDKIPCFSEVEKYLKAARCTVTPKANAN